MQTKLAKFFFMGMGVVLGGCTSDSIPEEGFESPTLDFPLLGNVPDRPDLPDRNLLSLQRKHLQGDHDQAIEKEAALKKSVNLKK